MCIGEYKKRFSTIIGELYLLRYLAYSGLRGGEFYIKDYFI